MFKIDKDVPMPNMWQKYPLGDMEIGDSFFLPRAKTQNISPMLRKYSIRNNKKFSVRAVDGGVRVWRIG